MDQRQIDLVRDSFVQVLVAPDRAARLFYDKLFELAPETRSMFVTDLGLQGRRLVDSLARIVTGLTRLEEVRPDLERLAIRHIGYGVEDRHYAAVGKALIYMISTIATPPIDTATRNAWIMAYAIVSDTMIDAARGARAMSSAA